MKIKVKINDVEHEVESSALTLPEGAQILEAGQTPTGFMSQQTFQTELARRTAGLVKPDSLLTDAEHWKKIAAAKGLTLDENGNPKVSGVTDPEEVKKIRAQVEAEFEASKLKPLSDKLTTYEKQVGELRQKDIQRHILEHAANAGVKDAFLKGLEGAKPMIVSQVLERFKFDEERGEFGVTDANGHFLYGENGKYAGADLLFKNFKGNKDYGYLFDDQRQGGSGASPSGGSGGSYRISREDARDASKYNAAKEAATKAGQTLEVTE